MAGRRSCMNSLWSGSERVRIGERLKASLAGIMELDLLRFRHWEMVEEVLGRRETTETPISQQRGNNEWTAADGSTRSRRQQVLPASESGLPCFNSFGDGIESRWSTLSWDIPSDPLSPPTPDLSIDAQLDCDSRPSSGFYSVSGSSLSDSCCSVCSEGTQGALGGAGGVRSSWGPLDCRPRSSDHSTSQWRESRQQPSQSVAEDRGERRPVSTGELEISGLLFLTDLCPGLSLSQGSSYPIPDASNQSRLQLDPKFCSDLVSRKTKEVYPYPSPLHAVALQSPLFTSSQDQTVNHRGSLELKGTGFSPQGFSRSMDWSGITQEEADDNPAKVCDGSPKISENSAKISEIARVSGLPRSVVVGLLEEGVELDEDCFRTEAERGERAEAFSDGTPATSQSPYSHSQLPESDQSASHADVSHQGHSAPYSQSDLDSHPPSRCPPALSDSHSTTKAQSSGPATSRQPTPTAHFDCHPSVLAHPLPHARSHLQTPSPPGSPSDSHLSERSTHPATHSPTLSLTRSPYMPAPLSVFHRDSPSQSSLPRFRVHRSPLEGDWRPRGGSLRQEPGVGWESGGRGWRRAEGERLYQGKHASRELAECYFVVSLRECWTVDPTNKQLRNDDSSGFPPWRLPEQGLIMVHKALVWNEQELLVG
ncbi:hypothetical protein AGOR_G00074790 [Albula goreensis]|uniref:Uncharacterized protein n=1 Tax=Albula goreensis TaxID=1534307 RepID=A0A8T3DPV7_9TELE|nr:hypothetical protein AGOR_G00074790 [Albula goreensis]